MFSFKNMLYGSPAANSDCQIPYTEFKRVRAEHDNAQIRNKVMGTEDLLLQEITDPETGMCDLN